MRQHVFGWQPASNRQSLEQLTGAPEASHGSGATKENLSVSCVLKHLLTTYTCIAEITYDSLWRFWVPYWQCSYMFPCVWWYLAKAARAHPHPAASGCTAKSGRRWTLTCNHAHENVETCRNKCIMNPAIFQKINTGPKREQPHTIMYLKLYLLVNPLNTILLSNIITLYIYIYTHKLQS